MLLASASDAAPKRSQAAPLIKVGDYHLRQTRQGAACAVLDGRIYVFGGASGKAVTLVERFDTRTNQVEPQGDHLMPRRYHAVIEHNGKFHLFGGEGYAYGGQPFEREVEIFDPATREVSRGPAMPRPKGGMAAAKLGNKAYFIGGSRLKGVDVAQTNETDVFDFDTGTWSIGVPMPTPRESRAAVVGDFILVVAGYGSRRAVAEVEMFVPRENGWKSLPSLDRPVSAHSLAFLGDKLYLFGDYADLGSTLAYDLQTRKTVKFRAGFTGVRHTCTAVVGERIYVIGGNESTGSGDETDLIQVFSPNPASMAN